MRRPKWSKNEAKQHSILTEALRKTHGINSKTRQLVVVVGDKSGSMGEMDETPPLRPWPPNYWPAATPTRW